jgi:hypothetical protein
MLKEANVPDDSQVNRGSIRYLCEALFSLHLAFAGMSMLFTASSEASRPFVRMEYRINDLLHICCADFTRGYFGIWIPSVCVAALLWILIRALARKPWAHDALPSVGLIVTLFLPAAYRLFIYQQNSWPVGWPLWVEIGATVICTALLISGKWRGPYWTVLPLILAHYRFWYFLPGSEFYSPGYAGPGGPILGLCSALAWSLYFNQLKRVKEIQVQAT